MNPRDKCFVDRELKAWAAWMKQGRTFPNTLGFKSSTVEWALMRGETGGDGVSGSKIPTRFNCDRNVATIDRVFWHMPVKPREAVSGVYIYCMPQKTIAAILGVSDRQVRNRLMNGYEIIYSALTNT